MAFSSVQVDRLSLEFGVDNNSWDSLATLTDSRPIQMLEITEAQCSNEETVAYMVAALNNVKSWQMGKLTMLPFNVDISTWEALASLTKSGSIQRLDIKEAECSEEAAVAPMMKALNGITSWKVEKLTLGEERLPYSSMSNLRCETDGRLQCDRVVCYSSGDLSILCKILQTCNRWSLGELWLWLSMTSDSWSQLATVAGRGEIDKVVVNKWLIREGRREDVEAVKRVTREWKERW